MGHAETAEQTQTEKNKLSRPLHQLIQSSEKSPALRRELGRNHMFNPSPQQQAIFDEIEHGNDSLFVEAVAGSGKTTTIVEATKRIPTSRSCLFLAFNKNIATELQKRLPPQIQAKTFHSHGFGALQRNLPRRPKVDDQKMRNIFKDQMGMTYKEFELYYKFCSRLVGLAKNAGMGTDVMEDTDENWWALVDHHTLVLDSRDADEEKAIWYARQALYKSNANVDVIDFDDMLYLCVLRRISFDKNNFVFLDEAQDTNAVQRYLLKSMLAAGYDCPNCRTVHHLNEFKTGAHCYNCEAPVRKLGRLIAVGDPAQAIYGFRGADANALEELANTFNCKRMPLSVSWRCSKNVIKEARKYVQHIEPADNAPDGEVKEVTVYTDTDFKSSDVILCRNTAPLVSMAFAFIRRNRGVRILGREIGQGLISLVKKMNSPSSLDSTLEKLDRYRDREVAKMLQKGHESAAETLTDRIQCINIFADSLDEFDRSIAALLVKIDSLFNDQSNGGLLTLCSVHKAKGLEWDIVNILDFETYMPSKWAKQEWQKKQEINLIYVAITRARHTLRYISSGCWKVGRPLAEGEQMPLNDDELSFLDSL